LWKILPSLIISSGTAYLIRSKQKKNWEAQEFLKAVQISLNYLDEIEGKGTTLQFRTLDECQVNFLMNENSEGIAKILAACDTTTVDQAFLGVDSSVEFTHLDMFMKAVINRISVKFADGYMDYDFGIPVLEKKYWLGLTCERPEPGAKFQRKIRVMVISDGCLRHIPDHTEPPKFEFPGHKARWKCLQQMHDIYLSDEKIKREGQGRFWERLVLRQVSIFRPIHYKEGLSHVDSESVTTRKGEKRHSTSSNLGQSDSDSKFFSTVNSAEGRKIRLKQRSSFGGSSPVSQLQQKSC
jgi:hypothetical protein